MAKLYEVIDNKVRLNLHPGQTTAWESEKPIIVVSAGTRGGKTAFAPWWLHREIMNTWEPGTGNDYLAVSPTNKLFEAAFLPSMLEVFSEVLDIGYYWSSSAVMELRCMDPKDHRYMEFYQGPNGRSSGLMWGRVLLRSAQSEGALESMLAKAAILDEAGQDGFTIESWEAVQRRTGLPVFDRAIDRRRRARTLITTTLYDLGWLYTQLYSPWLDGQDDIDFIQFPSYLNPAYDKAEYDRMKLIMPAWRFAMFYDGKYMRPAGLIYGDFDEATMLEDDFAPPLAWERVVGVDFGGANVAITFSVYNPYSGYWTIYDELLMGHMSAADYVNAIRTKLAGCEKYTVIGGAKSEDQFRRDWRIAGQGLYVEEPLVFEVEPGIERVIGMFKRDKLHVCRGCTGLRNELRSYRRKLDDHNNPTEQIVNKNMFHFLDSVRYAASYITDEPPAVKSMSYAEYMRKHHHG